MAHWTTPENPPLEYLFPTANGIAKGNFRRKQHARMFAQKRASPPKADISTRE